MKVYAHVLFLYVIPNTTCINIFYIKLGSSCLSVIFCWCVAGFFQKQVHNLVFV